MKKMKIVLLSGVLAGSLFVGGRAALASDYGYGWRDGEIHSSFSAVERARHRLFADEAELRRDLRDGAGWAEIAYDRRMIARDRRILAEAQGYGWRDSGWNHW
jgi:hypothetical protein